jgi:TolB protein
MRRISFQNCCNRTGVHMALWADCTPRISGWWIFAVVGLLGACVSREESAQPDRLVYTAFVPGNSDIYRVSGGASPERLTDDPAVDYGPVASADGRWLVFTSERRGQPDLYALDLTKREPPRLLIDSESLEDQAALSRDGKTLYFVSTATGDADIYAMPFSPEKTETLLAARNLTSRPGADLRPAISPDGTTIVFSSDRDSGVNTDQNPSGCRQRSICRFRSTDLYLLSVSTGEVKRLTETPGWDGSPAWSLDGRTIAFYSERNSNRDPDKPQFDIWTIGVDGTNAKQLVSGAPMAVVPRFNNEGRIFFSRHQGDAFYGPGSWRVASVGPDGQGERIEVESAAFAFWDAQPAVDETNQLYITGMQPTTGGAPTGITGVRRFVLGTDDAKVAGTLTIRHLPGGPAIELTALRHAGALLNPGADQILFTESLGADLTVSALDGISQRRLQTFEAPTNSQLGYSWSRDGSLIAYTRRGVASAEGPQADVWVMRADGTETRNLTEDIPGYAGYPTFSSDGKQIAFNTNVAGTLALYIMNVDGSEKRVVFAAPGRHLFPVFSPRRQEIAFISNLHDPSSELYEIYLLQLGNNGQTEPRRITHNDVQEGHVAFSPEGDWLVFSSEEGGINDETPLAPAPQAYGDMYAVRIADGYRVRLTANKWEEGVPSWEHAVKKTAETIVAK